MPTFFQIVAVHRAQARPKLMPTFDSPEDLSIHSRLAVQVQYFVQLSGSAAEPVLYHGSDPVRVTTLQLGRFSDLIYRCFRWKQAAPCPDRPGCLILSDKCIARPEYALNDEACPTLMVIWALNRQGWRQTKELVVHTLENLRQRCVDGRGSIRHKLYFMVCLQMEKHLARIPAIPSGEPQLFYRLLLSGVKVAPNLGVDAYKALCNKRGKRAPLPIPEFDEPITVEPPPLVDEDLVVPGLGEGGPPPGKKRKREKPSEVPLPIEPPALEPPAPATGSGGGHGGSSSSGGAGGGPGGGGGPPLPDPDIVVAPEPVVDADLVVPEPEPGPRVCVPNVWHDGFDGARWCYKNYRTPGGKLYPNFQIKCPTPEICGTVCKKTKGATKDAMKVHGRIGPMVFLYAWRHSAPGPGETHGHLDPSNTELDAVVALHQDQLEELVQPLMDALP